MLIVVHLQVVPLLGSKLWLWLEAAVSVDAAAKVAVICVVVMVFVCSCTVVGSKVVSAICSVVIISSAVVSGGEADTCPALPQEKHSAASRQISANAIALFMSYLH